MSFTSRYDRARLQFQTGAGTWLSVGTIADGEFLKRVGTTLVSGAAGGGSGNSLTVAVDFGASFTDKAQTVVTGQSWVAVDSEIVAHMACASGTDPDEMRLLNFQVIISDLVAGDGFTVTVYSEPEAKGTYNVMCIGV